jgi:hypothetical protein
MALGEEGGGEVTTLALGEEGGGGPELGERPPALATIIELFIAEFGR